MNKKNRRKAYAKARNISKNNLPRGRRTITKANAEKFVSGFQKATDQYLEKRKAFEAARKEVRKGVSANPKKLGI